MKRRMSQFENESYLYKFFVNITFRNKTFCEKKFFVKKMFYFCEQRLVTIFNLLLLKLLLNYIRIEKGKLVIITFISISNNFKYIIMGSFTNLKHFQSFYYFVF